MKWNQPFSTDLRTGADFVHGWFALLRLASPCSATSSWRSRDREALAGDGRRRP